MRIALLDFGPGDYTVETIHHTPMGGTQSGACYLAENLAALGHHVWLLNHTTSPGRHRGVESLLLTAIRRSEFQALGLDVAVIIQRAGMGEITRGGLKSKAPMVLWAGDTANQPVVAPLSDPAERDRYDGFAFVSKWQAERFIERFQIDPMRVQVMRNAIAPAFESLFPSDQPIVFAKSQPPILAYTSAPYRGLELLLDIFPSIRHRVAGTRLEVYSSMQIHGLPKDRDEERFGLLYQRCRETDGVDYIGPVPQPELAHRLKRVAMLAYPNIFEETGCIAAMEAMAAGCRVVSSDLGALPETTAGFARLIPFKQDREQYKREFIDAAVSLLESLPASERELRRQVDYVGQATWLPRAEQWSAWLESLPRG